MNEQLRIVFKKRKQIEKEGIPFQDWMRSLAGVTLAAEKEKLGYTIIHPAFKFEIYIGKQLVEREV